MQKIKNMLHHHHEAPAPPAHSTHPITAVELESTKKELYTKEPVLETTTLASEPILTSTEREDKLIMIEPVNIEKIEKDVVVHEHIHPIQKEEIQPVIYREREQLEVKQITENLHETKVEPTLVQERELAPVVKAPMVERAEPIPENLVLPTVEVDPTLTSVQVNAPLVNETIKKTIIEEVQPVLEKDVVVPVLIKETQPIYEKIVEAPILVKTVLPTRELSGEPFDLNKVNPFLKESNLGKATIQNPPTVL